ASPWRRRGGRSTSPVGRPTTTTIACSPTPIRYRRWGSSGATARCRRRRRRIWRATRSRSSTPSEETAALLELPRLRQGGAMTKLDESAVRLDTTEVDKQVGREMGGGQLKEPVTVTDIRRWAQGMQY